MKHWIGNTLRGMCMGLADAIPGVSGATVALVFGIYPRLINAVAGMRIGLLKRLRTRAFRRRLAQALIDPERLGKDQDGADASRLLLLASLGLGILPALATGASFLPGLLDLYPAQMRGLFLGLVLASVTIPVRTIKHKKPLWGFVAVGTALVTAWFVGLPERTAGHARGRVTLEFAAPLESDIVLTPRNLSLVAPDPDGHTGVVYGVATSVVVPAGSVFVQAEIMSRRAGVDGNLAAGAIREARGSVPVSSVSQPEPLRGGRDPSLAFVFVAGVLAISAMSLPGLSGAFVLLLLGLYHFVTHSLRLAIFSGDPGAAWVVATMGVAMTLGLLTFARVVKRMFCRWRDATLAALVGLILGSLRKLWPFVEYDQEGREVMTLPGAADPDTGMVLVLFLAGVGTVAALGATAGRGKQKTL